MLRTEIFNLIILDESGSMSCVKRQTINGCNETINTIKSSQEQFSSSQDHYVSIYAFQSNNRVPSRYLIKNVPAMAVKHITDHDYEPWGGTPLYDAVGSTLVDLKAIVNSRESAIGSVTIITDGEENSSTQYSAQKVSKMIAELKEMGWSFNFIGANIDVKRYADSLNIDNAIEFQQSEEGTKAMFEKERQSRMAYNARVNAAMAEDMDCCCESPSEVRRKRLIDAAKDYFKK